MKAEKYIIVIEINGLASTKVRFGYGAAGEEVQKILEIPGLERIRIKVDGKPSEATFLPGKTLRLLDIKQRIKSLTMDLD